MWTSTSTDAAALDSADDVADLRAHYNLTPGVLRLDGYSDGARPNTAPARLRQFMEHRWERGISHVRVGADSRQEARSAAGELAGMIGADPGEIGVGESTSMNLFRALLAAAKLRPDRRVLAVGHDCFASDQYLARSAADFTGCELHLIKDPADLETAFRAGAAVLAVSHTDVLSGEVRDPVTMTAMAHENGALALWDLSHSAGALRVDLNGWNADFAIGCGYRYLGGGPGAPGFNFIAQRHRAELRHRAEVESDPKLFGAGVLDPFDVGSTPSAFSTTSLRSSLAILKDASPEALEHKTTGLVEIFLGRLLEHELPEGMDVVETLMGGPRGAHLCIRYRHAQYLADEMFARGIAVDFLESELLRLNFAPTWLRYIDAWEAAETLCSVLDELQLRL